jgi:hypothetical protein
VPTEPPSVRNGGCGACAECQRHAIGPDDGGSFARRGLRRDRLEAPGSCDQPASQHASAGPSISTWAHATRHATASSAADARCLEFASGPIEPQRPSIASRCSNPLAARHATGARNPHE